MSLENQFSLVTSSLQLTLQIFNRLSSGDSQYERSQLQPLGKGRFEILWYFMEYRVPCFLTCFQRPLMEKHAYNTPNTPSCSTVTIRIFFMSSHPFYAKPIHLKLSNNAPKVLGCLKGFVCFCIIYNLYLSFRIS